MCLLRIAFTNKYTLSEFALLGDSDSFVLWLEKHSLQKPNFKCDNSAWHFFLSLMVVKGSWERSSRSEYMIDIHLMLS